ncbi:MAG: SMI1/KNR4 family protein [Myxococcales bacterium]|nr:SMI1/KNR4 family protein [Myxococcales bacterium]
MTTIREKVSLLDALRRELRESFGVGAEEHRMFPPPAPGEVRAHERRTGRSLPPSFKAFLELANGWSGFMKGLSLLGLRRRETELLFREGLDEKILAALPDLVPDHELRSLPAREKTDPKVLSPRDRLVLGVDGRGSALVFDERSVTDGEPSVALVKYVWVQRSWPSFAALLDDAIGEAQAELDKRKGLAAATAKAGKKGAGKRATKANAGDESAKLVKRRVVEIRPSKAAKKKPATKKSTPGPAKPANATKPTKAPKPAKKKPAPKKSRR